MTRAALRASTLEAEGGSSGHRRRRRTSANAFFNDDANAIPEQAEMIQAQFLVGVLRNVLEMRAALAHVDGTK